MIAPHIYIYIAVMASVAEGGGIAGSIVGNEAKMVEEVLESERR